jgi:hypothetical protein
MSLHPSLALHCGNVHNLCHGLPVVKAQGEGVIMNLNNVNHGHSEPAPTSAPSTGWPSLLSCG